MDLFLSEMPVLVKAHRPQLPSFTAQTRERAKGLVSLVLCPAQARLALPSDALPNQDKIPEI